MNTASGKIAVGEAHSKLILVGEHAVVYGKPAVAIPFPLKIRAFVQKAEGSISIESDIYTGSIDNFPINLQGISACIKETLHYLKQPLKGLHISIDSAIPIGRGLGSSAAIAVAIVRILFNFYGEELVQDILFALVHIAETYAHGKPSGIDMNAVSNQWPICFQKGKETINLINKGNLCVVVADTGRIGDTRRAVENVRAKYDIEPKKVQKSLDEIEKIAAETKEALAAGDMYRLGALLNRNQGELISLGVSDEGLNKLIQTARNEGALGAKLTGGGLGGCLIAIAENMEHAKSVAKELIREGAAKSWYFSTAEDSLYSL
jgi:mevalonate kinase